MKPKTKLQIRVDRLSRNMKPITERQLHWGYSNTLSHFIKYNTRAHTATCMDCGHQWKTTKVDKCPFCGAVAKVLNDSRQRKFEEESYYAVVQKVGEFTVIRIFYIWSYSFYLRGPKQIYHDEVLQHWISDDGKDTIRSKKLMTCLYTRKCPFNLHSEIEIRRDKPSYNGIYRHICPTGYYPKMRYSAKVRRNGFDDEFEDMCPEDVLTSLLTDNRFETLWKLGMKDFARSYLGYDQIKIIKYWSAVMSVYRKRYKVDSMQVWLDYLDLLDYFHKDWRNPQVSLPEELAEAHERLVLKKNAILRAQEEKRRRELEAEQSKVLEKKRRYFDITFSDDRLKAVVLKTIDDYKREGDYQHHCVYSNSYYAKKDTIILSTRLIEAPDVPIETVEISLKDGKVLQCYGKFNRYTEYHQEILELMQKNAYRFIKNRKKAA